MVAQHKKTRLINEVTKALFFLLHSLMSFKIPKLTLWHIDFFSFFTKDCFNEDCLICVTIYYESSISFQNQAKVETI